MNQQQASLLMRVDQLAAEDDLDALIQAIDAARAAGLTRSIHGVPLDFLRRQAVATRTRRTSALAAALIAEADAAQANQNMGRARACFAQALAIPHLAPAAAQQVQARLERLDTLLRHAGPPTIDAGRHQVNQQLETLLADLRATRPTMYRLLALCAIPRWLDADIVRVLRQKDDGREAEVLARINEYSFVYPWESERYTLSADARRHFLAEWQAAPTSADYQAVNQRLAAHFAARLTTESPRIPARLERLRQAQLYHTFIADPPAGAALLAEFFQTAEDSHHLVAAHQYVIILQELRGQIPAAYFAYVEYAEGWLHHLTGNRNAAQLILNDLAQRTDLPPDLHARSVRGAAVSQVQQGLWVEGLDNFHAALRGFTALHDAPEIAETMAAMGRAYLQIAGDAMGEYDPLMAEYAGRGGALSLGALLVRLPIMLYLLVKLNLFWPLPNLLRLGQGLDWVIARLFSDAILWLRRAERAYAELEDAAGVEQTRETIGRLYWVLNAPRQALAYLEPQRDLYPSSSFAGAQMERNLADVYLALRRLADAQPRYARALAVFEQVGHDLYAAQCHNRLGALAEAQHDAPEAVARYSAALDGWQKAGNDIRVTQMLHRLTRLEAATELPAAAATAAAQARAKVSSQVYATRYVHPVALFYQRAGIIMYAVLLGLLSLISVEIQPRLDLISQLTLDASNLEHMNFTLIQDVSQSINLEANPPPVQLFLFGALITMLFILVYALVGIYYVGRAHLRPLQENNAERIEVDDRGVRRTAGPQRVHVAWADLRNAVFSTRTLCREAIDIFSTLALVTPYKRIEINGLTPGYSELVAHIRQRIDDQLAGPPTTPIRRTELGVSFFCRGWGRLFVGTLLLQALLLLAALINEDLLGVSLPLLPYTLADFWNVIELGVALPLLYWLIIQPARYRIYARQAWRNFGILWGVALLGMLVSLSPMQIARPALLPSVAALFTGAFILYDSWRIHGQISDALAAPQAHREARQMALLVVATLVVMGISVATLVSELGGFHHQAVGYRHFQTAQSIVNADEPELRRQRADAQTRLSDATARLTELEEGDQWISDIQQSAGVNEEQARDLLENERAGVRDNIMQAELALAAAQAKLDLLMLGYGEAQKSFERSLKWTPDARAYRFLLITLAYRGRTDAALDRLSEMQARKLVQSPRDWRLGADVLFQSGFDRQGPEQAQAWATALDYYTQLADDSTLSAADAAEIDRFRAAARFRFAGANQPRSSEAGEAQWQMAEAEFVQQIDKFRARDAAANQDLATLYAQAGSAQLSLGVGAGEVESRRAALLRAEDSFRQSIALNPAALAPYNGLGWTLVYLSRLTPDNCIAGFSDVSQTDDYIRQIVDAEQAFTTALELPLTPGESSSFDELQTRTRATYYRTRAQLRYILAYCDEDPAERFEYADYLAQAAGDYEQALALDKRAEWHDRLGDIRQELARHYARQGDLGRAAIHRDLAGAAYASAIALDNSYFATRKKLYTLFSDVLARDGQQEIALLNEAAAAATVDAISAAVAPDDYPEFLLRFAEEEYEVGLAPLALEAVTQLLKVSPDEYAALRLAALIYEQAAGVATEPQRNARYTQARAAAEQALAQEPDDPALRRVLGRIYIGLNDLPQAIATLEQSLAAAPQDPATLYTLAHAHLQAGDQLRAQTLYARANWAAQQNDPAAMEIVYAQAIVDLLTQPGGNSAQAATLAHEAAAAAVNQAGLADATLEELAAASSAANQAGEHVRSIPLWTRTIQLAPHENAHWLELRSSLIVGWDMEQTYSGEAVLTLLTGALSGESMSERAAAGDAEQRRREVATLIEIAQIDLADNYFGLAAAALERGLTLDRRNAELYVLLAETYARWGDYHDSPRRIRQAIAMVDRAQAVGIERGEIYRFAAAAHQARGDLDAAIVALRQATQLDPGDGAAFALLGRIAYAAGDYALSVEASQAAIALNAADPADHFTLGLAHVARGDAAAATAAYAAGITAANALEEEVRVEKLAAGINDLQNLRGPQVALAASFIAQLEVAPSPVD